MEEPTINTVVLVSSQFNEIVNKFDLLTNQVHMCYLMIILLIGVSICLLFRR